MTWRRLKEKLRAHGMPGWCDELPERALRDERAGERIVQAQRPSYEGISSELTRARDALRTWLTAHAFELWWTHGADHVLGGFHERVHLDLTPTHEPRRARLHPRQAFAYAHAAELGWTGPADRAIEHALNFFVAHYKRSDGFYRASVATGGTPVDGRIELYDQAFALLGFASAYAACHEPRWRTEAYALHARLEQQFRRAGGGFEESLPARLPLTSNSHMHLLEAALAWRAADTDARWLTLATEIVELAQTRLMSSPGGLIGEHFDDAWEPLHADGWLIEPGHQFEWGSLLLRFAPDRGDLSTAALRLIGFGENWGVDRQRRVVVNSCFADGSPRDAGARLWPQTERVKAACMAAEATGDLVHASHALEATQTLMRYFETPVPGLWRDRMNAEGGFVEEPAPANSFYHIVGAALALDQLVRVIHLRDALAESFHADALPSERAEQTEAARTQAPARTQVQVEVR